MKSITPFLRKVAHAGTQSHPCYTQCPSPKNWDNPQLNYSILSSIGSDFPRGGYPAHSGIVVNTSSCDWCSHRGMGGKDAEKMKRITINALKKLKNYERMFTE